MTTEKIQQIEQQIGELTAQLYALRKTSPALAVPNYTFETNAGETTLLDLFGPHDKLFAIHNMGQGCRYCTLWADGFNGLLSHLESAMSVVLLSKDPPELQRRFANSRGWRFALASHANSNYLSEQTVYGDASNYPGAVIYEKKDDQIFRKNACVFGPGDLYCTMWNVLGLAGLSEDDWVPQFNYWKRPEQLDDGGERVLD